MCSTAVSFNPKRKYLLFSSVDSRRSAHSSWLDAPGRAFDVVLYAYGGESLEGVADLFVKNKGYKFQNFHVFSGICDVSRYSAVWVVDDDIEMGTADINKMFDLFVMHDLYLAQPSYDSGSYTIWDMAVVDERYRLRYTNFVENGVTVFSGNALKKCLPVMKDIETGCGSDYIFPFLLDFPKNKIAIIDNVQCHHPDGDSSLDKIVPRVYHGREAERLMNKYHYKYYTPRVLGGIERN